MSRINVNKRNQIRARKYFGVYGDKRYVLHHVDTTLIDRDPKRYNEWRVEDLVVMTVGEHSKLHFQDEDYRRRHAESLSKSLMGHEVTEETREKLRQANLGKKQSQESIDKGIATRKERGCCMGERNGAYTHPEKNNFINNNPSQRLFKGTHYYNNGEVEVRTYECPEGFVAGRLPKYKPKGGNLSQQKISK